MLQSFVRHVSYPIWERLNGSRDLATLRELQATEALSAPALRDLQRTRLRAMLEHAHRTVPFYTEWFDAHGLRPADFGEPDALRVLPLLDKPTINDAGERLISAAVDRARIWRDSTGGSTGQPLYFYVDEARKSWIRALTMRENLWLGCRPGDRIARFWGSGRDEGQPRTMRGRVAAALVRRHRVFDAYQLADDKIRAFLDGLRAYRPALIVAYARAMFLAARYAEREGLRPYRPLAIVITSETVSAEERDTIARVFDTRVVNRYASRECGQVASGCGQSSLLHVNDESVVVQLEPLSGSAGGPARMVVTDLTNRVMPLIRYDTGDLGAASADACPCGRPLSILGGVEGRVFDAFIRLDGGIVPGLSFVHLFWKDRDEVDTFQIVQHSVTHVEVVLVLRKAMTPETWNEIARGIRRLLGSDEVSVTRRNCTQIEVPISGKHRFAISKVSQR